MDEQNRNDKPDLDLISLVQRGRMQYDQQAKPSRVSGVYWIEAKSASDAVLSPSSQPGQWVLDTSLADVDAHWARIKAATESNQLGYKSKVSTASRTGTNESRTICVCTYDRHDEDDVERVRAILETLLPGAWRYEGKDASDVSKP